MPLFILKDHWFLCRDQHIRSEPPLLLGALLYLEVDPAEAALLHGEVLGHLEESGGVALLLDRGGLALL